MFQRIPKSIWLVTFLVAVVLGIWPGVSLGQEQYIWLGVLVGWLAFPWGLYQLIIGGFSSDNPILWLQWLTTLGYPLAMLGYGVCAYWTIRRTSVVRNGLLVAMVAAFISALASIPAAMIAMSIDQHLEMNVFSLIVGYVPALSMHGIILIHLLISAVLGWLIGAGLTRIRRRQTLVVA